MRAGMLGETVKRLAEPGVAEAALIEAGELALLSRVEDAAAGMGTSSGELAAFVARRWLAAAGDEDWLRLIGVMGRSDQPGLAAIALMLEQALAELNAGPDARARVPA